MRVIRSSYHIPGFVKLNDYALRFAYMITTSAKQRARILTFWGKHGLTATREAFSVSRSTLYAWQHQLKAGGGKLEAINPGSTRPKMVRHRTWPAAIKDEIKQLRADHPNLGKEKIHVLLQPWCRQNNTACPSPRTIGRLMADMGGLRIYPQKVSHFGRIVPRRRTKVLRKPKHFHAQYAGHMVAFDTIERFIHGSRRYIITMTDTYSHLSWGWGTTSHASRAAKEFFDLVRQVFPVPLTYVLTDNGSEFKKHFAQELKRLHLKHYHTYPKCPKMNAHAERFNRTIQEEFVDYHANSLLDPSSFNIKLMEYLIWYNQERPHWSLKLKSPLQFLVENSPPQSRMYWPNTAC